MPDTIKFLRRDEWLSEMLGRDSFNLIVDGDLRDSLAADRSALASLESLLPKESFVQAKVDVTDFGLLHLLEDAGFRMIDTSVTFEKDLGVKGREGSTELSRFAVPGDEEQAVSLGARSMIYTRFHLDPLVGKEIADVLKGEWVRSFFRGRRGDRLVVAEMAGRLVGFLQIIVPDPKSWVIDLIAVDPDHRGRGIASDMIAFAESKLAGYERVVVGTQVANIPSIRMYEKLGFQMSHSRYILHFHAGAGVE